MNVLNNIIYYHFPCKKKVGYLYKFDRYYEHNILYHNYLYHTFTYNSGYKYKHIKNIFIQISL